MTKNWTRGNRRDQQGNDAIESRRAEFRPQGERGDYGRREAPRFLTTSIDQQPHTEEDRKAICLAILDGVIGEHHVFDGAFTTEKLQNDSQVIRFQSGLQSCALRVGGVRQGHYVFLNQLFGLWFDRANFRSEDDYAVANFLLSQPAMQDAMKEHLEKQRNEKMEAAASVRAQLLGEFKRPTIQRREAPKLKDLSEILSATWGTINHDGVEIVLSWGKPQFEGGERPVIVRIPSAPEGHAMAVMATENIFVFQKQLEQPVKTDPVEGKAALSRTMCRWLQETLVAAGALASMPQPAPRREAPKLKDLSEILSATWGTINHDGVEIVLSWGKPQFPGGWKPVLVRIPSAPEGHAMAVMATENIFVFQNQLASPVKTDPVEGKAALSRTMCRWLQETLVAAGALASMPKVEASQGAAEGGSGTPVVNNDPGGQGQSAAVSDKPNPEGGDTLEGGQTVIPQIVVKPSVDSTKDLTGADSLPGDGSRQRPTKSVKATKKVAEQAQA